MYRITALVFLLFFTIQSKALNDKLRFGLMVSPGISWMSPEGKDLEKGKVGFGANYGLVLEYYFKDKNYAFCTGIQGGMDAGTVNGRDLFMQGKITTTVNETYKTNYIGIPFSLKLKTNPIKGFRFFGQVGFTAVFNVTARATFDQKIYSKTDSVSLLSAPDVEVIKENILRKDNEVTKAIPHFGYNIFDFRLTVGGGFEYDVSDKTAVFFSLHYNNGFVNTVKDQDAKGDPIHFRNVLFGMGVMF